MIKREARDEVCPTCFVVIICINGNCTAVLFVLLILTGIDLLLLIRFLEAGGDHKKDWASSAVRINVSHRFIVHFSPRPLHLH